jgi:hypothetical protein
VAEAVATRCGGMLAFVPSCDEISQDGGYCSRK